jgi:class 3 adenylate cyclase/predicted ATPase
MDVAAWLKDLDLERYVSAFRDNDIDAEVLLKLTAEDLISIGVTSVGHRRKLLDAIARLGMADPTAVVTVPAPGAPAQVDAERRQLTVMFCDLVGSTALSTRHDPEDLRELIGDYHRAAAETVGRFDGFVAKYMGDGVLIYFGYPQAHEDDAERAVWAALAVIEAVGRLPAREDLRVRVGIATGLAVVGDLIGEGAAQERGVVGETPNLAARLQALATPNTLVIAEATRRQIGELFDLEDLGPQQLAGFAEPQRAWRVLGESGKVSRFEALRSGETPLVGRDEEVELLRRRWEQAKSGEGRVVLISGEPGIGKSRLMAALSAHIETEPHTRLRYFCSPHHQDSALYPFIARLERAAGFARDDTVDAKLGKLRALLAPGTRDDDDIALLSELLSLPSSAADLNLSPQRKREKLFEALLNQLEAEARRGPVLMVFEDAHWIDPTSRELLDLSVDRVRHLPVMLAITFRPEFQPLWGDRSYVMNLALNRLGERDGEALVHKLAGNAALTAEIVAEIVERTDGVPLFVEELTKAVLESAGQSDQVAAVLGAASLAAHSVPATLHASLMARLDRLGPVPKETAQIGAVLGREFSYELIERVAHRPERELRAALGQLRDAGLLFCRGTAPHASYLFKHALIQDAAYQSLLKSRRQQLHQQIAQVLAERFPETTETQPELLAHHYTEAGLSPQAIPYWQKAGERAAQRSANVEAISHLTKGLESLKTLSNTPERIEQELDFQATLGSVLMATKGFGAPEVESAYARARELCQQVGETPHLFTALLGMRLFYGARAKHKTACEIAEQCLRIAERIQDPTFLLGAHHALGDTIYWTGDFVLARAHQEQAIALYNPRLHRALNFGQGYDLGMDARAHAAWVLWYLGYPDQALQRSHEALTLAGELAHPFSLAHALDCAAWLLQLRREEQAVKERAEAAILLATEHRFAMEVAWGTTLRGWALAAQGQREEGISQIRQGLTAWQATEADLFLPWWLAFLAQAYGQVGQTEEGLTILTEALAEADKNGERFYEAELYRLRGELRLQLGAQEKAEEDFRQAITLARRQHAKSWELRAVMSLSRLWQSQGKKEEAHRLLTEIYGWFTEGFATADLQDAKALLEALA